MSSRGLFTSLVGTNVNLPSTSLARTMPVQDRLIGAARPHSASRLTDDVRGDPRRVESGIPCEAYEQDGLRGEDVGNLERADVSGRDLRASGVGRRLEQCDEIFRRVRGGCRVVDGNEVVPSSPCAERQHEAEKVRIGFKMRASKAGRDAANADVLGPGRCEHAESLKLAGQLCRDRDQRLPAGDLLLVRASVGAAQLLVVVDERLLDGGDFIRQLLQLAPGFGCRIEELWHRTLPNKPCRFTPLP